MAYCYRPSVISVIVTKGGLLGSSRLLLGFFLRLIVAVYCRLCKLYSCSSCIWSLAIYINRTFYKKFAVFVSKL